MRSAGTFYADTPHQGGFAFYAAPQLFGGFNGATISASLALTRNAQGDYSFNRTSSAAETYVLPLNLCNLKRLIEVSTTPMPFQEQFGTAVGSSGYPAPAPGLPPFLGTAEFAAPTGQPPKGIQITDVVAVYQVGVAALTAASLSLNRTVFANNVANAITNSAIAATALPLATQANPYVVTRTVNAPAFETADLSDINLELSVTMANTGTIRLYGLGVHVNFNYD